MDAIMKNRMRKLISWLKEKMIFDCGSKIVVHLTSRIFWERQPSINFRCVGGSKLIPSYFNCANEVFEERLQRKLKL